jgi:hypothetical protein
MKKIKFHKHSKRHFRLPFRLKPARILRSIGLTLLIIGFVSSFAFYMSYSSGVSARVYQEKFGDKNKQVTIPDTGPDKKLAIIALEVAGVGGIIYASGWAMKRLKNKGQHS